MIEVPETMQQDVIDNFKGRSFTTWDVDEYVATMLHRWNPDEQFGAVSAKASRVSDSIMTWLRTEAYLLVDTGKRGEAPDEPHARPPIIWRIAGEPHPPFTWHLTQERHDYATDSLGHADLNGAEPRNEYHERKMMNEKIRNMEW